MSRAQKTTPEQALLARITVEPGKCGGRPCIRGLRVRVIDVLQMLASGMTARQIVRQLPYLEVEDVAACLAYAASELDHPRLVA
ncbi:MAG: DUF433 domain-containing protein [Phycisphaerales bacterium]|nr:DUF433 domain-containing protein [Phycisphaerales bacterium]